MGEADRPKPVPRVWVPQVAVDVDALQIRADVAEALAPGPAEPTDR